MGRSASKIKMTSYDDLFETSSNVTLESEKISNDDNLEKVVEIPISNLIKFSNHPFKVIDNDEMSDLKESIDKYGILVPLIARPKNDGTYEIIAGHRRKYACDLLGKESIPTLIRDLDDEEATIIMVDSNLQRENLLYSEKAFAFKLKLEAIKRKSGRLKNNCSQVGNNSKRSLEIVAEEANESKNQVHRYIRLTELNSDILDMVDNKKLPFNTGVELSYLSKEEQDLLLNKIEELEVIPTMAQATKLKKYSNEETLTVAVIELILLENNQKPIQVTLKASKLNKYFSEDITKEEMEKTIDIALAEYFEKQKST